ncbi:hypothetical protein JTB14_028145 [Gonioctena quinquepunctata]|nr:hypothetical protein JTB14_028145 [Gonioctena quinquepunctata]
MSFMCCKSKTFIHYVCAKCANVYHRSCIQKNFKNQIKFSQDNKICCEVHDEFSELNEVSLLEQTVRALSSDNILKDKHMEMLHKEKEVLMQAAEQSEIELNDSLKEHKKIITEMKKLIEDLQNKIATKNNKRCIGTQTKPMVQKTIGFSTHDDGKGKCKNIKTLNKSYKTTNDKNTH